MKITLKNSTGTAEIEIEKEALHYFFDVALEFDIYLKSREIEDVLRAFPRVAFEAMIWGAGDTQVREEFFDALVEHLCGKTWRQIKLQEPENPYETAKAMARFKGYEVGREL